MQISVGDNHAICLDEVGHVWAWGFNDYGNLGDNTIISKSSPITVVGNHSFVEISAGSSHNLARKSNGIVWAWGSNGAGNLGDDSTTDRSSPVSIVGGLSFISVAAGQGFSLALQADGSVAAWGDNSSGQLGQLFDIDPRSSPVAVTGGHSFVAISADAFSMALMADGSAWAWGSNNTGQLGDNSTTDRSEPVSVVGNHSFIAISAGYQRALGLKADGSVWAWGVNSPFLANGTLGDGTSTNRSSPVSVVGSHSFIEIRAGYGFAVALKADGSAWAWGWNFDGEIGNNANTPVTSPVAVVGGHSFVHIACRYAMSAGQKSNFTEWMWGQNSSGQLGDKTKTNRSSPVSVAGIFDGIQNVLPSGFTDEVFGTAWVSNVTRYVLPSGFTDEAFGTPSVVSAVISPTGFIDEIFGTPRVSNLTQYLYPSGIDDEKFGTAYVAYLANPGGILLIDPSLSVQTFAAYGVRRLLRLRSGRLLAFRSNGIVTSVDHGQVWTPRSAVPIQRAVEITTGSHTGRLVGHIGPDVYVSDDAASSWTPTATLDATPSDVLEDVAVVPGAVLALLGMSLFRSLDGGATFEKIFPMEFDVLISRNNLVQQQGQDVEGRSGLLATTWLSDNRYVQFALNDASLARLQFVEDRNVSTTVFGTRHFGQRTAVSSVDDHLNVGFQHGNELMVRRYLTDGRDLDVLRTYIDDLSDEDGAFDLSMDELGNLYTAYVRTDGKPIAEYYALEYNNVWNKVDHNVTAPNLNQDTFSCLYGDGINLLASTVDGRIMQQIYNEFGSSDHTFPEWDVLWRLDHEVTGIWTPDAEHFIVAVGPGSFLAVYEDDGTTIGKWRTVPLPVEVDLTGVWGTSVSDVWAVGEQKALHFNGTTWVSVAVPTGTYDLTAVFGFAANDVYACGTKGTLLHWNGAAWSAVVVPVSATVNLLSIWGSSASDVWVGTDASGKLLHWNGAAWSNVDLRFLIDCDLFVVTAQMTNFTASPYVKGLLLDADGMPAAPGDAALYVTEAAISAGAVGTVKTCIVLSGLATAAPVGTPIYRSTTAYGGWTTVAGGIQVGIVTGPGTIRFALNVAGTAFAGWGDSPTHHLLACKFNDLHVVVEWDGSTAAVTYAQVPNEESGVLLGITARLIGSTLDYFAVRSDAPYLLWLNDINYFMPTRLSTSAVDAIGAGRHASYFHTTDDFMYGCGRFENSSGTIDSYSDLGLIPKLIDSDDVLEIASGDGFNLMLKSDGTVWSWGSNVLGQLGQGDTTSRDEPTEIPGLSNVVAVAAGIGHSLAVKSDGSLWVWGYNGQGQLGLGYTSASVTIPTHNASLTNIVEVAGGGYHSMALRSDGKVYTFGSDASGQIGKNHLPVGNQLTPFHVPVLIAMAITAGKEISVALTVSGTVYAWGDDPGDGSDYQLVPVLIQTGVTAISSNWHSSDIGHNLLLLNDGTMLAWGENQFGQLGDGTQDDSLVPIHVGGESAPLDDVIAIAAGGRHSIVMRLDGSFWTWGDNSVGQLGSSAGAFSTLPAIVSDSDWTNPKPWAETDFVDDQISEIDFVDGVIHSDSLVNVFGNATARWDGKGWYRFDDDVRTVDRTVLAVGGHVFKIGADGKSVTHFYGGLWHSMTVPVDEVLFAVGGARWTDVWFVGRNGTVLYYDGNGIDLLYFVSVGTDQWLSSVTVHDTDNVLIGGWFGTLLIYDRTTWRTENVGGVVRRIDNFFYLHNGDVYGCGRGGTLIRWEPEALLRFSSDIGTAPTSWPAIVHRDSTRGVMAWCHNNEVVVQRLGVNVSPTGALIVVPAVAAEQTSVAVLADGRFAVAYVSSGGVLVQFYDAVGTSLASVTVSPTGVAGSIAASAVGYAVGWRESDDSLYGATFSAVGGVADGPFLLQSAAVDGRPSAAWI
ncbi:MAG: hypothetical protein Q8K86_05815 [Candidatus Nanopelagicaceae bacterium]|nr:hypothetical protein [Candidatus Nanopelagicaceae bacterium]